MKSKSKWTGDFETTTDTEDCRVWAFALYEIGSNDNFIYGNSITEFMELLYNGGFDEVYFHNLKFDGQFIMSWLLNAGFEWVESRKAAVPLSFTTLISDMGQFYSIEIYFERQGKRLNKTIIRDSLKILNFSVENVAKGFGLPIQKLELDYTTKREIGHILTESEISYIKNDVKIMAMALEFMFRQGMTKSTAAANALDNYKSYYCANFERRFPALESEVDGFIRKSYKGGFTYLNPIYENKLEYNGVVLDVNSMYPYVMSSSSGNLLPFGEPLYYEGEYKHNEIYPLFVQRFTCAFEVKPGKLPTIQMKGHFGFKPTEYLIDSGGQIVELTLTSPDFKLFLEHYNVYDINYLDGFMLKAAIGLFDNYINYWMEKKITSKKSGNKPMAQLAKLSLNSLYGKFGTRADNKVKRPFLDEEGVVRYYTTEGGDRKPLYIPMASFITSYARAHIINSSQFIRDWSLEHKGYDATIYHDTDSIHALLSEEDLEELKSLGLMIDDYALGAWKLEEKFVRGKWLHAKCYMEEIVEGESTYNKVTVAGLPQRLAPLVTFDNFASGFTTEGLDMKGIEKKLKYHYCPGGVVLDAIDFTIQ